MLEKLDGLKIEEGIASAEEVEYAISRLTTAELSKIDSYAKYRILGLGAYSKGYTKEALLNEALTRTLEGKRNWRKSAVDLVGHLIGTIKSISSHWIEESKVHKESLHSGDSKDLDNEEKIQRKELLESEVLNETVEGKSLSPIEIAPSLDPDQERTMAAKQQLEEIRQMFSDDKQVLDVIDGLSCEMTGVEIQGVTGMTLNEYDAAIKRLRRTVRKMI